MISASDILMHYGTKEHSGRYPYGSGNRPYQHGLPLVNPGSTVAKDIVSGFKKGIAIASPLYLIGKTGIGIMAVKSVMADLNISTGVIKNTLSSLNLDPMSPKELISHIKTLVGAGVTTAQTIPPEELINMTNETLKNIVEK